MTSRNFKIAPPFVPLLTIGPQLTKIVLRGAIRPRLGNPDVERNLKKIV